MDKLILTRDDVLALIAWRDEHKAEVRSHPASLRALEIVAPEVDWTLKGIRDGKKPRLHVNQDGQSFGHCEFVRMPNGCWASTINRMQVSRDMLQSLLSIYCVVMAVMAYGWQTPSDDEGPAEKPERKPSKKAVKRAKPKAAKSITYILRRDNGRMIATPKGTHASPRGEFSVRGHYRHYASGKVVWIAEYRKGTGKKKKSKTYKMGGMKNAADQQGQV